MRAYQFPHTRGQATVVLLIAMGIQSTATLARFSGLRQWSCRRIVRRLELAGVVERIATESWSATHVLWQLRKPGFWRGVLVPKAVRMLSRTG